MPQPDANRPVRHWDWRQYVAGTLNAPLLPPPAHSSSSVHRHGDKSGTASALYLSGKFRFSGSFPFAAQTVHEAHRDTVPES